MVTFRQLGRAVNKGDHESQILDKLENENIRLYYQDPTHLKVKISIWGASE
jgi:hypothetical protein